MRVLDLDMDYFMTEIANTPFSCEVTAAGMAMIFFG